MSSSTTMHPIAIIGGGPAGLTTSLLLSQRSIPHILFNRHPNPSIHPKAVGINQRTMEVFRSLSLEPAIRAACAPPELSAHATWYTGFGENDHLIANRDMTGGGGLREKVRPYSPCEWGIIPQIRLEPILLARAREMNPEGIHFGTEVMDLSEVTDDDEAGKHVVLTVQDRATGETSKVRALYAIGADGGRTVTDALGIDWVGEKNVFASVTAHFRAPGLRDHLRDQSGLLNFFIDPSVDGGFGSGFMYHLGPYPVDRKTEEWAFVCAVLPGDPSRYTDETMAARIKRAFKLPDLDVHILGLSHWMVNAVSAARYRSAGGRIFLVGDAAHRIPPFGALGLNTGVSDVFNLVWKLDWVLNGVHGANTNTTTADLLDTYETERLPVGRRVAATSMKTVRTHGGMEHALGLSKTQTSAENIAHMAAYFDAAAPAHAQKQADVGAALKFLDRHFETPGAELGFFYPSLDTYADGEASRHDGQVGEDGEFQLCRYWASTIPGHNLPHAWVRNPAGEGEVVSTRDLMPLRKYLMVVRKREPWVERFDGEKCRVVVIGTAGEGAWEDVDGVWPGLCGTGVDGAVLVSPDGIVVARAKDVEEWNRRYTGEGGFLL